MPDRARLNGGHTKGGQPGISGARTEQPPPGSTRTIPAAAGLEKTWTITLKFGFPRREHKRVCLPSPRPLSERVLRGFGKVLVGIFPQDSGAFSEKSLLGNSNFLRKRVYSGASTAPDRD